MPRHQSGTSRCHMATDTIATTTDPTPAPSPAIEREQPLAGRGDRLRLLTLSFLMLFVELALIRWTGANNEYLAPLTNFVLMASFLGIGIGFLRADARRSLLPLAPVALALLVGFVLAFPVAVGALSAKHLAHGANHLLHGARGLPLIPRWLSIPIIFLLVTATLAGIGQETA
jgi:hypothetical protein